MKTILDFRSDTVTKPTQAMREAMARAEVGDDVLGDDPTVLRLQEIIAARLGKEAALFVPSGTMANLIAVRSQCRPGEEIIGEAGCHIFKYEQGGYAQLAGATKRPIQGKDGIFQLEQLADAVQPENIHYVRTRLFTLENTHNLGGGRVQPYDLLKRLCGWAREQGLRTHLDGARLFNAVVATGIEPARWASHFDTVSVCFSKGLGAPVGSALCGERKFISEAIRQRKVLGGGMRQSGILAAGAIYALENHVQRLAEDHANARRLAEGIRAIPGLELASEAIDTNMLYFRVAENLGGGEQFAARLQERGVWMIATDPETIRAVTHLDVNADDVESAIQIIRETAASYDGISGTSLSGYQARSAGLESVDHSTARTSPSISESKTDFVPVEIVRDRPCAAGYARSDLLAGMGNISFPLSWRNGIAAGVLVIASIFFGIVLNAIFSSPELVLAGEFFVMGIVMFLGSGLFNRNPILECLLFGVPWGELSGFVFAILNIKHNYYLHSIWGEVVVWGCILGVTFGGVIALAVVSLVRLVDPALATFLMEPRGHCWKAFIIRKVSTKPATGVPQRFGMREMMFITTFFMILFAIMKVLDTPVLLFIGVSLYFVGVGIVQAVFQNRCNPRVSSIIAGGVFAPLLSFVLFVIYALLKQESLGYALGYGLALALFMMPVGVLGGYLAGTLVAGLFLRKK